MRKKQPFQSCNRYFEWLFGLANSKWIYNPKRRKILLKNFFCGTKENSDSSHFRAGNHFGVNLRIIWGLRNILGPGSLRGWYLYRAEDHFDSGSFWGRDEMVRFHRWPLLYKEQIRLSKLHSKKSVIMIWNLPRTSKMVWEAEECLWNNVMIKPSHKFTPGNVGKVWNKGEILISKFGSEPGDWEGRDRVIGPPYSSSNKSIKRFSLIP